MVLDAFVRAKIEAWRDHESEPELVSELDRLIRSHDEASLYDAFYRDLSFGTAGIRGIMGVGTNRMNVHVVAQTMQGIADWINSSKAGKADSNAAPSVVLCRDSRINSERFERICAETFAANGIHVWLYPRIEPVPTLSFAVSRLGATAGVMVTSSHNPKQYNGCKIFAYDGCQIAGELADEISALIACVDLFESPAKVSFDEALADGRISWIPDEMLGRFLSALSSLRVKGAISSQHVPKVVYTPLNGTGLELMKRALRQEGIVDIKVVSAQAAPDGNFPTCPRPNPELPEAMELGLRLAYATDPDVFIATDPDADRMGTAVAHDGKFTLLSGNEMGVLLVDWLAQVHLGAGEDLGEKVVVSSIVTTDMLDPLAAHYGFQLRRTLTGFKNIGGQIAVLEKTGGIDRWLMGFEESYGYLPGAYVRDKDAISSCTLFVEMVGWYLQRSLDLVQVMERLYRRYGYYLTRTLNFVFPGAAGAQKMKKIMAYLHKDPPKTIGGSHVVTTVDYLKKTAMPMVGGHIEDPPQFLPISDVLEWHLEDGRKLIIRPSGTEPKIKCYLFADADTRAQATAALDSLENSLSGLLDKQ